MHQSFLKLIHCLIRKTFSHILTAYHLWNGRTHNFFDCRTAVSHPPASPFKNTRMSFAAGSCFDCGDKGVIKLKRSC